MPGTEKDDERVLRLRRARALDQPARWLVEHREQPSDGIRFEQMDVYDLPKAGLELFDIVMLKGIFYHLPDPVTALKGAAELCKELLYFDTAVRTDLPDRPADDQ
jgi:tRNA (mo5U34)-methyltransferase